jgi:anthranilate phosphoribosyltransferase
MESQQTFLSIAEGIARVVQRENLSEEEMVSLMDQVMSGAATPSQIAALITALRMKGETVQELTGAVRVMREKVDRVYVSDPRVVDTCGTGGDQKGTFNVSTTAAFVVAGAGVSVAKHGNRSVSGQCGSADVLAELGVRLDMEKRRVEECVARIGIGFLFAPLLHGAMKHAIGPRREIGIRTIFNLIGPLTNPAGAKRQLVGVYAREWTQPLARVLGNLGTVHALVVHGLDGLDEITLTGPTEVAEIRDGSVRSYLLEPEQLGFTRCKHEDLRGGGVRENAEILVRILGGDKGPKRDVVVLNSACAIAVAGEASDFREGRRRAEESIDSGAAEEKLRLLIESSRS